MRDLTDHADPFRSSLRVPRRRTLAFRSSASPWESFGGTGAKYTTAMAMTVNLPEDARVVRAALLLQVYLRQGYTGVRVWAPSALVSRNGGAEVSVGGLSPGVALPDYSLLSGRLAWPDVTALVTPGAATYSVRAQFSGFTGALWGVKGNWILEVTVE